MTEPMTDAHAATVLGALVMRLRTHELVESRDEAGIVLAECDEWVAHEPDGTLTTTLRWRRKENA